MPASLKSSLRSSRHNPPLSADLDSTPNISIGDSTTSMHLAKRLRPNATQNDVHRSSKRLKLDNFPPHPSRQPPARDLLPKAARKQPGADRGPGLAGASRVTSAVQPPSNGTIIAPQTTLLTNGESQTLTPVTATSLHTNGNNDQDKRTLRSHDGGSRSKSELALYFDKFDEIVSNEAKEVELLTGETRLYITEEPPKSPTQAPTFVLASPPRRTSTTAFTPSSPQHTRVPIPTPTTYQKLDFSDELSKLPPSSDDAPDPLPLSLYTKAHRRAERQEKQLRNIEKERAMHEKVQLDRLLEGLQGPDWLRVMGISGIVEGERKNWEDKRRYFVREVKALLEKFRLWKEEERRRKADKEANAREDSDSENSDSAEQTDEQEEEDGNEDSADEDEEEEQNDTDDPSAQQLHTETLSASASRPKKARPRTKPKPTKHPSSSSTSRLIRPTNPLSKPPSPKKPTPKFHPLPAHDTATNPLTSFFAKPHQRAAALDTSRRAAGRTRLAFGVPLPEMLVKELAPREFELPVGFVSESALRAAKRGARRRGREGRREG